MTGLALYIGVGWSANAAVLVAAAAWGYRSQTPEYRANALRGDAFLALCPWALCWFFLAQLIEL